MRKKGRLEQEARTVKITPGYIKYPEGSVLIESGDTKVICTASIENGVPKFLRKQNKGWLTAEYGMLPRSAEKRMNRESSMGRQTGRTQEIKRLIGRSLRSTIALEGWGERTVWIDCDVIQADGGTRTASITGAYVAMVLAFHSFYSSGKIKTMPVTGMATAISAGIVNNVKLLDLDYEEDSSADVDLNIVKNQNSEIIEIQGSAEGKTFSEEDMAVLLDYSRSAIAVIQEEQKKALSHIDLPFLK